MASVKGCPETFDVAKLRLKLESLRTQDILWPDYNRSIHDVVEDSITVHEPIVLIEGNWLLKDDGWKDLRGLADYTVSIAAREEDLQERLIARKVKGGSTREEAERFYQASDCINVRRTLNDSQQADETWVMSADGDYNIGKSLV